MECEIKTTEVCECQCHVADGSLQMLHMMPCCDLTYKKYLDADGNIINDKYAKALGEHREILKNYK